MVKLHEKDEANHASVIAATMSHHFFELSESERQCFIEHVPLAMDRYGTEDWLVWENILESAKIDNLKEVIRDSQTKKYSGNQPVRVMRSYERIIRFFKDLDINLANFRNWENIGVA